MAVSEALKRFRIQGQVPLARLVGNLKHNVQSNEEDCWDASEILTTAISGNFALRRSDSCFQIYIICQIRHHGQAIFLTVTIP